MDDRSHEGAVDAASVAARDRWRPGRGERLSGVDAAFLAMESPRLPMHIGGLFVFDPPDDPELFTFAGLLTRIGSRLDRVPRYRQRLSFPSGPGAGGPVWVDDALFDLAYHVRHAVLPAPGSLEQLTRYCSRVLSRRLDRSRPLWELYLIEGLGGGRVALLGKSHHAMVDGVVGLDIATVLLDDVAPSGPPTTDPPTDETTNESADEGPALAPVRSTARSAGASPAEAWEPRPPPDAIELRSERFSRLVTGADHALASLRHLADAPRDAGGRAAAVGRSLTCLVRDHALRPLPGAPLHQRPGQERRFALQRIAMADVEEIRRAQSGSVNDVVLAVVADAVGSFLRDRRVATDDLWLRLLVPVSTRRGAGTADPGNQVLPLFVDVPVGEMDPLQRLTACRAAMRAARDEQGGGAVELIVALSDLVGPRLHTLGSRWAVRTRLFDLVVSNVPGPPGPVHLLGARLLGVFPFIPLAARQTLAVGIASVGSWLHVGLTADRHALADVASLREHLVAAVVRLHAAAQIAAGETPGPTRTGSDEDVLTPLEPSDAPEGAHGPMRAS